MVDSKPLPQADGPPAYNSVPGRRYEYSPQQQHNYGAIPGAASAPGFHQCPPPPPPPPPYQYHDGQPQGYPVAGMGPAIAQQPYGGTYAILQPSVVVVGGCPACRVGVLEDDFTCLGIMCAILFFPLGILFCFALRQRTCPNCGATFG